MAFTNPTILYTISRALIGYLLWIAMYILGIVIIDKRLVRFGTYVVSGMWAFTLPFTTIHNLGFYFASVILLILVDLMIRKDIRRHIRINIPHIFSSKMTLVITVFSFILATQFFLAGKSNITETNITIPPQLIDQALNISGPILNDQIEKQREQLVNRLLEQLDLQLPILTGVPSEDKLLLLEGNISDTMRETLVSQGFSPSQIDNLGNEIKTAYETQITDLVTDQSQTLTGNLTEQLMAQIRTQIENILNQFIETNQGLIPWFLSLSVLLSFNSIGFIIKFFALGIATGSLKLLEKTKLVRIVKKTVETESHVINLPTQTPAP